MHEPSDLRRRRSDAQAGVRRRRRTALGSVALVALAVVVAVFAATRSAGPRAGPAANARATPGQPPSPRGGGLATPLTATAALARYGLPVFCAGHSKPLVALTFDDGPGPYTRLVTAKLRKHRVRATFFLVGRSIGFYPGLAALERGVGAVGDHTLTHPLLTALATPTMTHEIAGAKTLIEAASRQRVGLFRPPYGARNRAIDTEAQALGLLEVIWSVDSRDSEGANYAAIEQNVIAGMRPGAIILMHENRGQTVRALLSIFAALAAKHLEAVTVPELIARDPPSLAQLRAGGLGCGPGSAGGHSGA